MAQDALYGEFGYKCTHLGIFEAKAQGIQTFMQKTNYFKVLRKTLFLSGHEGENLTGGLL